jgi:hypothetical protein
MTNIFFINSVIKNCKIYQYGLNIYNIIKETAHINYIYKEVSNIYQYNELIDNLYKDKISSIIYNYDKITMPWLNSNVIQKEIINIGFIHSKTDILFDINYYVDVDVENNYNLPVTLYENIDIIKNKFTHIINKDFKSNSQAGQDLFVYRVLGNKKCGTYLDIGSHLCTEWGNNTLQLSKLGWSGIGFDIEKQFEDIWKKYRPKQPFILGDVTTQDWDKLIREHDIFNEPIDYMSFDIDDATISAIKRFPLDKIQIRVITIEHDSYRVGDECKIQIRKTLSENGYVLLCSDVMVFYLGKECVFEDWWINPLLVDKEFYERFRCNNMFGHNISKL